MPKLYLSRGGAAYAPPTVRGGWEQTTGHVVRGLHTIQDPANAGGITSVALSESSASANLDMLMVRAVSTPLAANWTFGGTLNLMLGVAESGTDANFAYSLHVFVTQGDTDAVRGTLLANYADPLGNEWPAAPGAGKALNATQNLTSVAALAGDRIVAEIGFRSYNAISSSRTGTLWHGGNGSDLASAGLPSSGIGFLDFSDAFTLTNNPTLRVSQVAAETLYRPTNAALRVTQLAQEVLRRPTSSSLRTTQLAVEVLRKNGTPVTPSQGGMIIVAT